MTKNKDTVFILGIIFVGVGLALLGGGVVIYSSTAEFVSQSSRAEGMVTGLERSGGSGSDGSYYPIVVFRSASGEEITFKSNVSNSPPAHEVGESVEVLYSPEKPEDAKINSFVSIWFGVFILGILGAVFSLAGGVMVLVQLLKRAKKNWLLISGQRIRAQFVKCQLNILVKVNNRSPFVIYAQWKNPMNGEILVFKSEYIWFDPSPFVQGRELEVLIDPQNPKKYWMDVSFLPDSVD
ncbi:MAG: DUF3592 domain-containing protein [Candidatus Liptonbacteria bacterium]